MTGRVAGEAALLRQNADLEARLRARTSELAYSEARALSYFSIASVAMIVMRRSEAGAFVCEDLNPAAETMYQLSAPRARGQMLRHLWAEPVAREHEARLHACAASGEPSRYATTLITTDGTRELEGMLATLPSRPGDPLRLLDCARDVTYQRTLERRTLVHAEREAALFQNSPDILFVVRVEGVPERPDYIYESFSPALRGLTALQPEDLIGRRPGDLNSPLWGEAALLAFSRCWEQATTVSYVLADTPPQGERVFDARVTPVQRACDGPVIRIVGSLRDVSERDQLQAQLRSAQRMEAMGRRSAELTHDFNNQLQVILGGLEMLREHPQRDAEWHECAAVTEAAARRGTTLARRLLAPSQAPRQQPDLLRPEEVVAALGVLVTHTLRSHRIRVEAGAAGTLWTVRADRVQLDECLLNLTLNARDAMPEGGLLRLRAENARPEAAARLGLPAAEHVCFLVEDQGTGMPPETMARAQEPFFTTKPAGKGTGLGLSMAQNFARQSGGELRIESATGRGTRVSLWLPRVIEDNAEIGGDRPAATARRHDRVLIVDDEAAVRRMLSMSLARVELAPIEVDCGEAALALLRAGDVCDLLVTDQSLLGMTGCDLIAAVNELRPALPTMLVTGYDQVVGLDQLRGRVTVLRKPFQRAVFVAQVQSLLDAL